ncbi:hypothetical protein C8R43DRAFT_1125180 [Mycena crocata]|nr:hypothetical protein C8R43DRAFT_1125180 [Mycena crocata]
MKLVARIYTLLIACLASLAAPAPLSPMKREEGRYFDLDEHSEKIVATIFLTSELMKRQINTPFFIPKTSSETAESSRTVKSNSEFPSPTTTSRADASSQASQDNDGDVTSSDTHSASAITTSTSVTHSFTFIHGSPASTTNNGGSIPTGTHSTPSSSFTFSGSAEASSQIATDIPTGQSSIAAPSSEVHLSHSFTTFHSAAPTSETGSDIHTVQSTIAAQSSDAIPSSSFTVFHSAAASETASAVDTGSQSQSSSPLQSSEVDSQEPGVNTHFTPTVPATPTSKPTDDPDTPGGVLASVLGGSEVNSQEPGDNKPSTTTLPPTPTSKTTDDTDTATGVPTTRRKSGVLTSKANPQQSEVNQQSSEVNQHGIASVIAGVKPKHSNGKQDEITSVISPLHTKVKPPSLTSVITADTFTTISLPTPPAKVGFGTDTDRDDHSASQRPAKATPTEINVPQKPTQSDAPLQVTAIRTSPAQPANSGEAHKDKDKDKEPPAQPTISPESPGDATTEADAAETSIFNAVRIGQQQDHDGGGWGGGGNNWLWGGCLVC